MCPDLAAVKMDLKYPPDCAPSSSFTIFLTPFVGHTKNLVVIILKNTCSVKVCTFDVVRNCWS